MEYDHTRKRIYEAVGFTEETVNSTANRLVEIVDQHTSNDNCTTSRLIERLENIAREDSAIFRYLIYLAVCMGETHSEITS